MIMCFAMIRNITEFNEVDILRYVSTHEVILMTLVFPIHVRVSLFQSLLLFRFWMSQNLQFLNIFYRNAIKRYGNETIDSNNYILD